VDEPREGLRASGAQLERRGGLAGSRAGRGSVAYPLLVQDNTEPQEGYQRKSIEKEVIYHGVSLLCGENEDRLLDA
jgi:hypothetical protein